eukprot:gb/GEZN01001673.1/.p1 GENE.gb/GEZN01001673.1/~~gb/GEZN01001673.1/.p1  ORF type:complete len:731 (-),score=77.26 gb/GEZN01001673.1/:645-2837(-)
MSSARRTAPPPLHVGELTVHRLLSVPPEVTQSMPWSSPVMPQQHSVFFTQLPYMVLATLDSAGRPWAHLVAGPPGKLIKAPSQQQLQLQAEGLSEWDPLVLNLRQYTQSNLTSRPIAPPVFAGLGIDFSNRRRNKVAGLVDAVKITQPKQQGGPSGQEGKKATATEHQAKEFVVKATFRTNESQGNCPKYINTRKLVLSEEFQQGGQREKDRTSQQPETVGERKRDIRRLVRSEDILAESQKKESRILIDPESRAIIAQADCIFVASCHLRGKNIEPSMDVNIRGGPAGLLQVDQEGGLLVWPEYSGNRIYSTLGNIYSDGVCGLLVPNFCTGDVLFLTGRADVLVGPAARLVMPQAETCVCVRPTALKLAKAYLGVTMAPPTSCSKIGWSPYNPPVRQLASQRPSLKNVGTATSTQGLSEQKILLLSAERVSPSIGIFKFKLPQPLQVVPGQFLVLDFRGLLPKRQTYRHMNEDDPTALNKDYVRTYTISHISADTAKPELISATKASVVSFGVTSEVRLTVKLQPGGTVSPLLHSFLPSLRGAPSHALRSFASPILAVGGEFSCFDDSGALKHSKMLWLAAGSGVTPFLAMWQELDSKKKRQRGFVSASSNVSVGTAASLPQEDIDVALLWSLREEDLPLASEFVTLPRRDYFATQSPLKQGKGTSAKSGGETIHFRRMRSADLAATPDLKQRTAFLCGPLEWLRNVQEWLAELGVPTSQVVTESFAF